MITKMLISSLILTGIFTEALSQNPVELGLVNWFRDIDVATTKSATDDKPVFILFQEVPGCITCKKYGQNILSHPLIVETIETYFVPLVIFNNKKGKDAEVLTFFQEPAWNNPVMRIVDENKMDVTNRVSGDYTIGGVIKAIVDALGANNVKIPYYLEILRDEYTVTEHVEEAYFSMYCFWNGEKVFGQIEGVVYTDAGYMDGKEVVHVKYDPGVSALESIILAADSRSCARHVYLRDEASIEVAKSVLPSNRVHNAKSFSPDNESKYYLRQTHYKYVPMTDLQATKANSLIGRGKSPQRIFSPRQLELLNKIELNRINEINCMINVPIITAWKSIQENIR